MQLHQWTRTNALEKYHRLPCYVAYISVNHCVGFILFYLDLSKGQNN